MPDNYEIKITTTADTGGATKTADALRKVGESSKTAGEGAKRHAEETGKLNEALQQFGTRGGEAQHAAHAITAVMQGGERSVFGLAKAFHALKEAAAANPFTLMLAALGAVVPLLFTMFERLRDTAEAEKEAAERAKEAAEEFETMKRAGEHAGEVKFDELKDQIKEVDQAAKDAAEKLDALLSAEERVDRAKEKLELLHNAANPMLSEEQKARNEVAIKQRYAERAVTRETDRLSNQTNEAFAAASQRETELQEDRRREQNQAGIVESLRGRAKRRQQIEKQIEEQRGIVAGANVAAATTSMPDQISKAAAEQEKLEALEKKLNTFASAEVLNRMIGEAEGRLESFQKITREGEKATKEAKRRAEQTLEINTIKEHAATEAHGLEDETLFEEGKPKIERGFDADLKKRVSTRAERVFQRVDKMNVNGLSDAELHVVDQARMTAAKLADDPSEKGIGMLVQALRDLTAAAMLNGHATKQTISEFQNLQKEIENLRREQQMIALQVRNADRGAR